jgi:hypothetical protein
MENVYGFFIIVWMMTERRCRLPIERIWYLNVGPESVSWERNTEASCLSYALPWCLNQLRYLSQNDGDMEIDKEAYAILYHNR